MATLRLRDNFAGSSWETGVAPLIQKRGERKKVKEERKRKRVGVERRERKDKCLAGIEDRAVTLDDSTNGKACKKVQYAIFDSIDSKISSIIHRN